jgi:hypothetical protein
MRDKNKLTADFKTFITENELSNNRRIEKIQNGLISADRLNIVKQEMSKNYLYTAISKYSDGYLCNALAADINNAIQYAYESWDGFWKLRDTEGKQHDQYILSAYDEMLWMLSLGYLLNIPEEYFLKLVEVIDRDKVKDKLFEFIIRAKIKDRPVLTEESYIEHFNVPQIFEKLRTAIDKPKAEAEKLVKEFIEKDWYKNHKGAGWYDSHKGKHNTYFGYWSFETAAVVKIMGLDDRTFRDCSYYPKELI